MTCDDIKARLTPFLDDLLIEAEYKAYCDHLNACEQCREHVRSIGSLSNQLWKLGKVRVPEDFGSTILYKFSHFEQMIQSSRVILSAKHVMIGLTLMLLGITASSAIHYFRNRQPPPKEEDVPIVRAQIVGPRHPPSDEEARILMRQLEVIAAGVGMLSKVMSVEGTPQETAAKENITDEGIPMEKESPVQENEIIDFQVIPLHWHFQYPEETNEAALDAKRQRIKQQKELAQTKLDEIESTIRLLEEEKEKNQIKLGQPYSQELKETKLARERQIELGLQQWAEGIRQQNAVIGQLEESNRQLEFNRQERLKEGKQKETAHRTKISNILNISGIMPDYKNDHLFVFSSSGEKLKDVRDQILFASQGTSSFHDYANGEAVLPDREYRISMFFDDKGNSSFHWHINAIRPEQKSNLLRLIEEKSASIDYKSEELLIFSVPNTELQKLLIRIQAAGVHILRYGSQEIKKDISQSRLISISVYFAK